jgi:hypothetical protein
MVVPPILGHGRRGQVKAKGRRGSTKPNDNSLSVILAGFSSVPNHLGQELRMTTKIETILALEVLIRAIRP